MIYKDERIKKLAKIIKVYEQKCDDGLFFLFGPDKVINRKIKREYLDQFNSLVLEINHLYGKEVMEFHFNPLMTLEYHFDGPPASVDVTFMIHQELQDDLRKLLMR